MKKLALITSLCVLGMSMTGCQVFHGERTVSQYSNDSVLTAKVKQNLALNKYVPASRINVQTDKGVVLLNGFVTTKKQKDEAGEIAKMVQGVVEVKNNLVVTDKGKKHHHVHVVKHTTRA